MGKPVKLAGRWAAFYIVRNLDGSLHCVRLRRRRSQHMSSLTNHCFLVEVDYIQFQVNSNRKLAAV